MAKHNNPLVSVIIPAFNEPPSIVADAIQSILKQTYTNIETHVFDDSTNQDTRKAIDQFCTYPNFFLHRNDEKRFGFVHALNVGLDIAKGDYIARMDSDDISYLDRIQKQVAFLEKNPDIDILGGTLALINQDGQAVSTRKYPVGKFHVSVYSAFRCPLAHPTVMMRRKIVDDGFRYNESLKKAEDLDFWLRLLVNGYNITNMRDPLLKYRITNNFLEKRGDMNQLMSMAKVRKNNMSIKHPFFSVSSFLTGFISTHIPKSLINTAYRMEIKS